MADPVKILFIADIVGDPGLKVLETFMPALTDRYRPDVVIANGENAHEGRGLNDTILKSLFRMGVDVVTGGNHSFDKHLIFPTMRNEHRLLRPFNFPKGNPGFGFGVYAMRDRGLPFCVINLIGRTFMAPVNDPFEAADYILRQVEGQTPFIFVDMHAEATAEKMAMGWHLDGRVSAVIGTHTHIPSGDARILPNGTGYQTDAGMTGAFHTVLGMDIGTAIRRFTLSTPQRYQLGEGDVRICGTLCTLDGETGMCIEITPVIHPEFIRRV